MWCQSNATDISFMHTVVTNDEFKALSWFMPSYRDWARNRKSRRHHRANVNTAYITVSTCSVPEASISL